MGNGRGVRKRAFKELLELAEIKDIISGEIDVGTDITYGKDEETDTRRVRKRKCTDKKKIYLRTILPFC